MSMIISSGLNKKQLHCIFKKTFPTILINSLKTTKFSKKTFKFSNISNENKENEMKSNNDPITNTFDQTNGSNPINDIYSYKSYFNLNELIKISQEKLQFAATKTSNTSKMNNKKDTNDTKSIKLISKTKLKRFQLRKNKDISVPITNNIKSKNSMEFFLLACQEKNYHEAMKLSISAISYLTKDNSELYFDCLYDITNTLLIYDELIHIFQYLKKIQFPIENINLTQKHIELYFLCCLKSKSLSYLYAFHFLEWLSIKRKDIKLIFPCNIIDSSTTTFHAYLLAIHFCYKAKKWRIASLIKNLYLEDGNEYDSHVLKSLLMTCCQSEDIQGIIQAFEIFQFIIRNNFIRDYDIYYRLLTCLNRHKLYDEVFMVWNQLLIDCSIVGRAEMKYSIANEGRQDHFIHYSHSMLVIHISNDSNSNPFSLQLNDTLYSTYIHALCCTNNFMKACEYFEQVICKRIRNPSISFNLLRSGLMIQQSHQSNDNFISSIDKG